MYYIYLHLNNGGSNTEDDKECAAEAVFGLSFQVSLIYMNYEVFKNLTFQEIEVW